MYHIFQLSITEIARPVRVLPIKLDLFQKLICDSLYIVMVSHYEEISLCHILANTLVHPMTDVILT